MILKLYNLGTQSEPTCWDLFYFNLDNKFTFIYSELLLMYGIFTTIRHTILKGVMSLLGAISVFNTFTRRIVILEAGMGTRALTKKIR